MGESGGRWRTTACTPSTSRAAKNAARRTASCATAPRCTRWNRMNESKDNGQLQNKHASSKPKESEKGDACTLVLFCARRLANRAEGKRGFLTGRPCRHRGLPPPPPPPSPSNTMARRRLTLYAPMMPSSFRFVLSAPSFPAWLFGLPAPPPAQPETPEILPPRPKTYLGNVEPQTHFAPPVGTKGFFTEARRVAK